MTVDPVGFSAGNPISFNRYSYVSNNPYRYIDPTGMESKEPQTWQEKDNERCRASPLCDVYVFGGSTSTLTAGTDQEGRTIIEIYDPTTGVTQTVPVNLGEPPLAGGAAAIRAAAAKYGPKAGQAIRRLLGNPNPTKLNRHGRQQPYDAATGKYLSSSANPGLANSVAGRFVTGVSQGFGEGATGATGAVPVGTAGSVGYNIGYVAGVVVGIGKDLF